MKLYMVHTKNPPEQGEVFKVYVVAADERHAERLARRVYWNKQKIPLLVEEADMEQERIVGFLTWYR